MPGINKHLKNEMRENNVNVLERESENVLWLSIFMHLLKLMIFIPVYNLAFGTCDSLLTIASAMQNSMDRLQIVKSI